ncbi:MAG TPA: hypothetical protein VFK11_04360 [Candidatus Saccharimonadales bacterium]|nr:hypothetical protein [Candidatus Saccharimonadales bacterium]
MSRGFGVDKKKIKAMALSGQGFRPSHESLSPIEARQRYDMLRAEGNKALEEGRHMGAKAMFAQMNLMGIHRHDTAMRVEAHMHLGDVALADGQDMEAYKDFVRAIRLIDRPELVTKI